MRALLPGQIGFFVSAPGDEEAVTVGRRSAIDISDKVSTVVSNLNLSNGVFAFDLTLQNNDSQAYLPLIDFSIVEIQSGSGTIRVINAGNGGSGLSADDPAVFGYSDRIGSDDIFTGGEISASSNLQFSDERSELFTFTAIVTAHVADGNFKKKTKARRAHSAAIQGSAGNNLSGGSAETTSTSRTNMLRYTVNPLTGMVDVELVEPLPLP